MAHMSQEVNLSENVISAQRRLPQISLLVGLIQNSVGLNQNFVIITQNPVASSQNVVGLSQNAVSLSRFICWLRQFTMNNLNENVNHGFPISRTASLHLTAAHNSNAALSSCTNDMSSPNHYHSPNEINMDSIVQEVASPVLNESQNRRI